MKISGENGWMGSGIGLAEEGFRAISGESSVDFDSFVKSESRSSIVIDLCGSFVGIVSALGDVNFVSGFGLTEGVLEMRVGLSPSRSIR